MTRFLSGITATVWAYVLAGLLAVTILATGVQTVRINGVTVFGLHVVNGYVGEVVALTDRIENPKSGYIARLSNSQHDVGVCQLEITSQNTRITALSAAGDAKMKAATVAVAKANQSAASAWAALDAFQRHQPTGATECDRYRDVDAEFLKVLNR